MRWQRALIQNTDKPMFVSYSVPMCSSHIHVYTNMLYCSDMPWTSNGMACSGQNASFIYSLFKDCRIKIIMYDTKSDFFFRCCCCTQCEFIVSTNNNKNNHFSWWYGGALLYNPALLDIITQIYVEWRRSNSTSFLLICFLVCVMANLCINMGVIIQNRINGNGQRWNNHSFNVYNIYFMLHGDKDRSDT